MTTVWESTITCPHCGCSRTETMPTDRCIWYWECPACKALVTPNKGDCCVYCSFGDRPCPPVQLDGKSACCRPTEE